MLVRKYKKEFIYYFLILLCSAFFVLDFFIHSGRPATFDAPFHITNIAQYSAALRAGDFPVYWLNGFANFGLPIGIVAHQLPSYLGAILNLLLNNPTLSFNILVFVGIFLSSLFYYFFLRLYFPPLASFLAIFMFNFAPYRILNAYIRGAEPEIFSNIFLPLILISVYKIILKRKLVWVFAFVISVSLLSLTHPMNLLIYTSVFGPYILFCLWQNKNLRQSIKDFLILLGGGLIALGMAGYYLLPLNLELKYFYIGLTKNQLAPNHFLNYLNFFTERWEYETAVDKITRGHIVQIGLVEIVLFAIGIGILINTIAKKRKFGLVEYSVITGLLVLFFTTSFSSAIYDNFLFLGNIQFPWRMLNAFIFIPPIIAAYLFSRWRNLILVILFVGVIVAFRSQQLYGKDFKVYPDRNYYFTQLNVHSDLMNTIWADKPQNYPIKTKQYNIIGGKGSVEDETINNSRRDYRINAKDEVRMVDYTFFFPGWKVHIDGKETPIQFQDANYRGLITYMVPEGKHNVTLGFYDTKIRLIGKLVSITSIALFLALIIFRKRFLLLLNRIS